MASAIVAQSWERSRRRGIDPDRADPPVDLQGPDLSAHLAAHRMAAVLPVVEKVLVSGVMTSGHLVAVADADGRLLWLYGDRGVRTRAERMAFVPGALWSDDAVGANAPGLALRRVAQCLSRRAIASRCSTSPRWWMQLLLCQRRINSMVPATRTPNRAIEVNAVRPKRVMPV